MRTTGKTNSVSPSDSDAVTHEPRPPRPTEGLTYHQPGVLRVLQTKEQTQAYYDRIALVYDLLAEHAEAPVRRAGIEMLKVRKGEKILEIGFGTGHSLVTLGESVGPTGRVFGIDLSEEMRGLSIARLKKQGLDNRVELSCGDALRLPYSSDRMHGIFMSFMLELFDTPEILVVLSECRRVLMIGGRIVVVGMSRLAPHGLMTEDFGWTRHHFPSCLDCRPILVRHALGDAGFYVAES